jgi:uncharacterized protein YciI
MSVFAVTTARGSNWQAGLDIREQADWDAHARFADNLVERGLVILGGPIAGEGDDVGLLAMEVSDPADVEAVFSADPWVVNGVLRIKDVRAWRLWLDGRR